MIELEKVLQLPCHYETAVDESHLDENNHMNVRHYLGFFDDATYELFAAFGMGRDYYLTTENGSFALEMHINYLAEVRLGESFAIYSRVVNRTAKRIHFMHFMVNKDRQNVAAVFEGVGSHVNTTIRRTSPFPDNIAEQIDAILDQHKQLTWEPPVCGVMSA
ncbi:MAG: thioesterase family protein [Chloroflexota bacterium]